MTEAQRQMRDSWSKTVGELTRTNTLSARYIVHISAAEWRWVILVASALALLAFAPLVWVAARGIPEWQFMGALHNYLDGATYYSKMMLGLNGEWLVYFQHTPEAHSGAFIQILYLILGHLSRVSGVPLMVMFHVTRVGAALFMYVALYQLGATIWMRIRTRRIFFAVVSVGAGFGWLLAPLTQDTTFPDLSLPEAFPFYSTLMNVHFPLTLACLALLVSLYVLVFRPGASEDPFIEHGWPLAGLLSIILAFLYPQSLVPIIVAVVALMVSLVLRYRRIDPTLMRWALATVLPAIPIAIYYGMVVMYNPAMAEWNAQNVTSAPSPIILVLGFGLPLLLSIPGIVRAVRRFERDGDRLMILWLLAMIIAIYLPTNVQRRFAVGMMIPIAYFATRSIEDVWLPRISRRWRTYVFAVLIPVLAISQFLMLFLPVLPAIVGQPIAAQGVFLERDYAVTYGWLNERIRSDTVILAAPIPSAWIPGWAGGRVVYGHPYETLDAEHKRQQVLDWYNRGANCAALLEEYDVRYVLYGPQEMRLGQTDCLTGLQEIARFGSVTVYANSD